MKKTKPETVYYLTLKPAAEADLQAIYRYSLENFGRNKARQYIQRFDVCFQQLKQHPKLGKDISQVSAGMRACRVESHIVYYRQRASSVIVVRVLHKSMLVEAGLQGYL